MAKFSALIFAGVFLAWMYLAASDVPRRDLPSPVLVELFTSEGCSTCPPADALLQQLDRTQPVGGAQLIVLSEHVDYWNQIGWVDPYSSRFFSDRQSAYSDRFGLRSVYTPQMVVDGSAEFVGNDSRLASQAVQKALAVQKVASSYFRDLSGHSETLQAHVETETLPEVSQSPAKPMFILSGAESCRVSGTARRKRWPPSEPRGCSAKSYQNRESGAGEGFFAGRSRQTRRQN